MTTKLKGKKLKTKPVSFTPEMGAEIATRYASGETIRDICLDPDMPSRGAVYKWLGDERDTRSQHLIAWQSAMAEARVAHAYALADDAIAISDDGSNDVIIKYTSSGEEYEATDHEVIARSKLRVDVRLKLIEKLAPERFGNAVQITGANGGAIQIEQSPKDIARRIAFAMALGLKHAAKEEAVDGSE